MPSYLAAAHRLGRQEPSTTLATCTTPRASSCPGMPRRTLGTCHPMSARRCTGPLSSMSECMGWAGIAGQEPMAPGLSERPCGPQTLVANMCQARTGQDPRHKISPHTSALTLCGHPSPPTHLSDQTRLKLRCHQGQRSYSEPPCILGEPLSTFRPQWGEAVSYFSGAGKGTAQTDLVSLGGTCPW